MKFVVEHSYEDSCRHAAQIIAQVVRANPKAKLGLATGSTPAPVYRQLIAMNQQGKVDFSNVSTVNLDEYCGLLPSHPQSYRQYMDKTLFDHINIDKNNTYVPLGTGDMANNARELDERVAAGGPPDLQLLGIGNNGHIAFNEAGPHLMAASHVEQLTQSTIQANARFFASPDEVPTQAITMGMKSILAAKQIVLVATGAAKAPAIRALLVGQEITTQNPATFLKLHPNATVIIDEALAKLADMQ